MVGTAAVPPAQLDWDHDDSDDTSATQPEKLENGTVPQKRPQDLKAKLRAEMLRHAAPLIAKLRGEDACSVRVEDFLSLPDYSANAADKRHLVESAKQSIQGGCSGHVGLKAAGQRPLRAYCNSLSIDVALYCISQVTGFPEKLLHQTWDVVKAACLHKSLKLHLKGSLFVSPRTPSIGVAAPGSKKTPVQQELTQCFREVLTKKPFLAENAGDGQQLLGSGGNQAAFLKQLRLNEGYMVMMIDELVNFFDVNFPQNGTTNANSYIIPTTLLPLRTGDGIAKSLSSDLKNQVDSTQVAMSFMGQDRHEKRQGRSSILVLEAFPCAWIQRKVYLCGTSAHYTSRASALKLLSTRFFYARPCCQEDVVRKVFCGKRMQLGVGVWPHVSPRVGRGVLLVMLCVVPTCTAQ